MKLETGIVIYIVETVQEAQMLSKYHSIPLYNGECHALKVPFASKKEELTQF